jgi:hypothetical protein
MKSELRRRFERRVQGQGGDKRKAKRQRHRVLRKWLLALPLVLAGLRFQASLPFAQPAQLGGASELPSRPLPVAQLAQDLQPRLTVRIYNYAHLDHALLTDAQVVATAIFKGAGVETAWVDCPLSSADFEKHPACRQKIRTTDVVLRVMPASMAAKVPTSDDPLGFAQRCPDDERGCVANVFYAKVDELSSWGGTGSARILAHAMAHEIGHLLLGEGAHSPSGLMRGVWSPDDLKFMSRSYLFFTPRQADQLQASLARRAHLELKSDLSPVSPEP